MRLPVSFSTSPNTFFFFLNLVPGPTSHHLLAIQMIILRDERERDSDDGIRGEGWLERWLLSPLCVYDTSMCNSHFSTCVCECVCACGNMRIDAEG